MSDCPGTTRWKAHCPGCAEREQLRAQLAQAKSALSDVYRCIVGDQDEKCWCSPDRVLVRFGHSDECMAARRALADLDA